VSAATVSLTRFVINPYREEGARPQPSREPIRAFHRSLPGYLPTPLVRRPDLARQLGLGELFVKYEGPRFGLGAFKGLGASWALRRLVDERAGAWSTVSTASEGNHGRAVAWSARLLGIPCVIFLPASVAPERVANIRQEGARVELVEGSYEDAVRRCDRESARQGWQVVSDVGYEGYMEVPLLVVEGYSTLFTEVDEQMASAGFPRPDVVLIPGGVGALLHAGVDHYRQDGAAIRMVTVEPAEGDCLTASIGSPGGAPARSRGSGVTSMACLNCAEVSLPSWPAIRRGVDLFLSLEDRFADEAVRRLHRAGPGMDPIDAGHSGAATTGGLIALAEEPLLQPAREFLGLRPGTIAVALCTEGPIDRTRFHRVLATA
jgi:diaminopropionate ammonia-lyase